MKQAAEMDTFILISPGGISEGDEARRTRKDSSGKSNNSLSLPSCMPSPCGEKSVLRRCPMYVGPRGLLTFATHTHTHTLGRKGEGEREEEKAY